jgi:long-chain acyl-CoA synthetase
VPKNKWNKYLSINKYENLAEMALATIKKYGTKAAIRWFAEDGETIEYNTYEELGGYMKIVFGALHSLGYRNSDTIAICSETRREWVYADLGVQALGGITVAVYPTLKPKEIAYILQDSETKLIFVDTEENLTKILAIEKDLPNLKDIVVIEPFDDMFDKENIFKFDEFLRIGELYDRENPKLFFDSVFAIKEDDLASLIYTSGTTGVPKGVMLTHKNFLSDAYLAISVSATLRKGEKPWEMDFLTLMPFAHSFGRTVDYYCVVYVGATMNIIGKYDAEKIRKGFERFKPNIVVGIPYLYQKIYNIILEEVASMPKMVQNVFNAAIRIGREYADYKMRGEKPPFGLRVKARLTKLVGKVIRGKLGGRLKMMVSGSAAISEELMIFFNVFEFNLLEGYGLTETAPVTHVLRTSHNSNYHPKIDKPVDEYTKLGKIGPTVDIVDNPYEPVEHKLTPEGELLIRGPMVMKGYWKKSKITEQTIDKDGWLHTGDLAEIDEDGYASIKGRAKVIIKLMTGKMISPAAVENLIVPASRKIAQIILVGDDSRKYLTSIVVPYQEPLKEYADQNGIKYDSLRDLIHNKEVQNVIKQDVLEYCEEVSNYTTPKKFLISCKAFDASEDFVTPTYKFKRNKIYASLKDDIDRMYETDEEFVVAESRVTDFYDQSMIIA